MAVAACREPPLPLRPERELPLPLRLERELLLPLRAERELLSPLRLEREAVLLGLDCAVARLRDEPPLLPERDDLALELPERDEPAPLLPERDEPVPLLPERDDLLPPAPERDAELLLLRPPDDEPLRGLVGAISTTSVVSVIGSLG